MQALLDVVAVEAKPNYLLHLEFENGEKRIFDMSPYMDKQPFVQLKGFPVVRYGLRRKRNRCLAG